MICDYCGREGEEWDFHQYPNLIKCKDKGKCKEARQSEIGGKDGK